jgi:hypothetical protein
MVVKERHIGALYIDGKKVADKCEEIVETVELDMDFRDRALNFPEKLTVTFSDFRLKRNDMLSLMYGMKITNNYLKLHGGIMTREVAGRKGKRKW